MFPRPDGSDGDGPIQRRAEQAKKKAKGAAWEGAQLGAGTLLALLAGIFALLAVLTALAFAIVALAAALPTWLAGLIGAVVLAMISALLGKRASRELRKNAAARKIARTVEEGQREREKRPEPQRAQPPPPGRKHHGFLSSWRVPRSP